MNSKKPYFFAHFPHFLSKKNFFQKIWLYHAKQNMAPNTMLSFRKN